MTSLADVRAQRAHLLALAIANKYGMSELDILGRERTRHIAAARRELYVQLWRSGMSIADVGRTLGMNHATIIYGLRKAMGRDEYEREVDARWPSAAVQRRRA